MTETTIQLQVKIRNIVCCLDDCWIRGNVCSTTKNHKKRTIIKEKEWKGKTPVDKNMSSVQKENRKGNHRLTMVHGWVHGTKTDSDRYGADWIAHLRRFCIGWMPKKSSPGPAPYNCPTKTWNTTTACGIRKAPYRSYWMPCKSPHGPGKSDEPHSHSGPQK